MSKHGQSLTRKRDRTNLLSRSTRRAATAAGMWLSTMASRPSFAQSKIALKTSATRFKRVSGRFAELTR